MAKRGKKKRGRALAPLKQKSKRLTKNRLELEVASAERQLAATNDAASVRRLADRLNSMRKIVGEVTGKRVDINKVAKVWVRSIRKGGRLLREMKAHGERAATGGDQRSSSRGARMKLADLGFSYSRASRWELAESLPQDQWDALEERIEASEDGIITIAEFLAAAKHRRREQDKFGAVTPTTATIEHASCFDWLPMQEPCDLLATDPPYSTDVEDIEGFAASWLPLALDRIKNTGRAYVCIGAYPAELRAYLNIDPPDHMVLAQVLVWTYRNTLGPSPTHDYKLNWQAVLYYRGVNAPPLDCPQMTEQFSVQDINAPDGRHGDRWHAWQKPDELCERFVRHASKPGDLVLDPFAGSGSFLLAAAKLGRVAHGCELDPAMVELAQSRGCNVG